MYKIMTPGPTQVAENVRLARSRECTNPDLDESFVEFYKETCEEISRLLHTDNETLILGGEGILGLEAACASMTEPGDRVLVLDNGIYGKGFADFVSMYGGIPELYSRDYRETLDVQELEEFLKEHHNYKRQNWPNNFHAFQAFLKIIHHHLDMFLYPLMCYKQVYLIFEQEQ